MTEEYCGRCEHMRVEHFCSPRGHDVYSCLKYKDSDDQRVVLSVDREGLPFKLLKCIKENDMEKEEKKNEDKIREWLENLFDAYDDYSKDSEGYLNPWALAPILDQFGFVPPEKLPDRGKIIMVRNSDADNWQPAIFDHGNFVEDRMVQVIYVDNRGREFTQMRPVEDNEVWKKGE